MLHPLIIKAIENIGILALHVVVIAVDIKLSSLLKYFKTTVLKNFSKVVLLLKTITHESELAIYAN